jgi:penicillin-binding protein 1A
MEKGWARVESQPNFRGPTYAEIQDDSAADRTGSTRYLQGMFVALDPATGEVKALIGGRDYGDSKFNRATQARRQPGSVFKPFVYTAAIASGIPASHTVLDAPVNVDLSDGTVWSPRNFGGRFDGEVTLRDALRRSVNVPAVKIGMEVGLETVAQYAKRMGVSGDIPRVPSLPIGVPGVLPIDIAEAYTTFANLGVKVEPRPILRVEDSQGKLLWETEVEAERVLDPRVAFIMVDMLRDVVNTGSAYSVRDPARGNVPGTLPAAGKTGTTNDGTDVWFAGFTPNLLAVTWLGFDQPQSILPNAAGGVFAAPIWADFMRPIYFDGQPAMDPETGDSIAGGSTRWAVPEDWQRPDGLRTAMIDRESGKLFSEDFCPPELMTEEFYLPGTEPTELCDLHAPGLFGAPLRGFEQVLPDTAGDRSATDTLPPPG